MPATPDPILLPAKPESLAELHAALSRFWEDVAVDTGRAVPPRLRFALLTAAAEVAANIIRHAEADDFDVALLNHRGRSLEVRLRDRGIPYHPAEEVDTLGAALEGGFGLALARRVVHALEYRRTEAGQNVWSLVVHLPPPAPA